MDLAIIPECFIDTNLLESIIPPRYEGYNHQKGWPKVVKHMTGRLNDSFALGVIDKDKNTTDYANEFVLLQSFNGVLELHKHRIKHHYIIYIIPAAEKWMIECAEEVGIDAADFDIHFSNLRELQDITKDENSKKDVRFKNFFRELKRQNSKAIIKLAKWVEYLRDNNYNVDIETLKQL